MHLSTLSEWMSWIESLHTTEIDLGLDRIKMVAQRLQVLSPACPVIIVGGTNGKGSTVAGLESIYRAAGYKTATFTSPVLFKQNEQVCINHEMASDQALCEAFAEVEAARASTSLTPFEFCTLAALCLFKRHDLDVWIMEVGLGGRLDAVNILEPDVSVVTSIGIDHVNWLGTTREQIGYEKAGIFRNNRPAVCGDFEPPLSLLEVAANKQAKLYCQGRDFDYNQLSPHTWSFKNASKHYENLPVNTLALQNMATVLMTVSLLQNRLPVDYQAINLGLKTVALPARIQIIPGLVTEILDVAHNPAAVSFLKEKLKTMPCTGKTIAVFSMLADKDITASILAIHDIVDVWHVSPLLTKRAATKKLLSISFQAAKVDEVTFYNTIRQAYQAAKDQAKTGDRIIVFGSFHTISEAIK